METLRKSFNYEVAFSDHIIGGTTAILSAALGATIIEKYFTQRKKLKAPYRLCSLKPSELKNMITAIRLAL